jgi:squalene-hopene/tetraprenyl-beta-curcumene cyclase
VKRGFAYLSRNQREDGAWVPLWFGNQQAPRQENPVVGTARVLLAYAASRHTTAEAERGIKFLLNAQNADSGWGGASGVASSVEETALALIALTAWRGREGVAEAVQRGAEYLVRRVEDGTWVHPAPLGLYFARLWYAEQMYPLSWTVEALAGVAGGEPPGSPGVCVA